MRRAPAAIFTAVALCVGCSAASDHATPSEMLLVRAQLDTLWSGLARAMTAGDTAMVAAYYTDSAYFAETGAPTMRGSASIRSGTARVFACCRYLESRVQPELTELSGERAFQFGTYRDVIQPSGRPPLAFYGRFAAVLQRDSAAAWRISRVVVIRDSSAAVSSVAQ